MAGRGVRNAATTIDSLFRSNAARRPDASALIDPPDRKRVTGQEPRHFAYAQADRAVEAIAARLRQIGLPDGTVVGLQMPNIVESILTLLAITRAGMVPAPLPLLWRKADCVAALSRAGARAIVTYGHVDDTDHAELALGIAAELFPIRVVCGFGCGRVDGIVPFDDCLSADVEATHDPDASREPSPSAAITFDMTVDGPVAVLRDHMQLLAGGVLVQHRAAVPSCGVIVSTIPASSFAGLATSFLPWLLSGGTLVLHHPFEPDALASQIAEHGGNVLVIPDALLSPLTQSDMLDPGGSLKTVIALWRSPERLSTAARWPADAPHLVDAVAFGEALLAPGQRARGALANRRYCCRGEGIRPRTRQGCANAGGNARSWRRARRLSASLLRSGNSRNARYRRYRLCLRDDAERANACRHRLAGRARERGWLPLCPAGSAIAHWSNRQ
jgi:hypothetical protein